MTSTGKPGVNAARSYRRLHRGVGLHYFNVRKNETDLHIGASRPMPDVARAAALEARRHVVDAIRRAPAFLTSFSPIVLEDPLPVARAMLRAADICGVGPMAAVAGAISAYVGHALMDAGAGDVIVENGGDLFVRCLKPRIIAVYAGDSPFTGQLGLRICAPEGCGICTSAGRVGPSVSLGDADAMLVLAADAALADACATAAGNLVLGDGGVQEGVQHASTLPGIRGALAIRGEQIAVWGELELLRL